LWKPHDRKANFFFEKKKQKTFVRWARFRRVSIALARLRG
jgi:hypothetical protein